MNTTLKKMRIQLLSKQDAIEYKGRLGGWIAIQYGSFTGVYWYQGYTQSEIMMDLPGNVEIL